MQEQSFEELAKEAATGLKSDPELFLDVKQELQSHLEDKAQYFASQGNSEEESAALSRQSFGSPMDVAAELLDANCKRMKFRSLLRLAIGALVVPIAILLALYMGYGRVARIMQIAGGTTIAQYFHLPILPFQEELLSKVAHDKFPDIESRLLNDWETHRNESDGYIYYAYYAPFVYPLTEKDYVDKMRKGELIEPDNALYNLLIAHYYLSNGIKSVENKSNNNEEKPYTDVIANCHFFDAGINELRKAITKPYLSTYETQITHKNLLLLPDPILIEDYVSQIAVSSSVMFPSSNKLNEISRNIPIGSKLLLNEGKPKEAEELMDMWKPFALLIARNSNGYHFIRPLMAQGCAAALTNTDAKIYSQLGLVSKAQNLKNTNDRIKQIKNDFKRNGVNEELITKSFLNKYGGSLTRSLVPIYDGVGVTMDEISASRMLEHTLIEEIIIQVIIAFMFFRMISSIIESKIWLYNLRGSASVPILLLPPIKIIFKAIFYGIILPMMIYWIYSRFPVIGGREYSLAYMWPRFLAELIILFSILYLLPIHILGKYIHSRCNELGITAPNKKMNIKVIFYIGMAIVSILVVILVKLIELKVAGVLGILLTIFYAIRQANQSKLFMVHFHVQ